MKTKIHPSYVQTTITCACGRVLSVGSTVEDLHVEICSACHPFYTGKQKLVDTARRVEKFQEKMEKTKVLKSKKRTPKTRVKAASPSAAPEPKEASTNH